MYDLVVDSCCMSIFWTVWFILVSQNHARLHANRGVSSDLCVPVMSSVAIGPCALFRAVGERHAGVHADAARDGHAGAVDGGEVVLVEVDVFPHADDLAKVDGGEVVGVEVDVATHAGYLAKVDGGEVVGVEVDGLRGGSRGGGGGDITLTAGGLG